MIETENKNYRGMLVEVIVKSFTADYLFDSNDELKKNLQEKLDLNLKFDTKVSEIETKNEHTFSKISFEDENGKIRVIDFTIIFKSIKPEMNTYKILEKNKLLFTDVEAEKRLKTGEYTLLKDYGIDKKFIAFEPYIPLLETPLIKK